VHVLTLNISEFCENRRRTGRSTVVGGQRSYVHMRTVETYDILTVKNASVKSVCRVTECSICSLVGLSFSPPSGVLPSAGYLVSEDTRCISAVVQYACRGRHKASLSFCFHSSPSSSLWYAWHLADLFSSSVFLCFP